MNRREFIKTAGLVAGGTAFLTAVPANAAPKEFCKNTQTDLSLTGGSDIHIHCAPDLRPRSLDELEMAQSAKGAGYRSIMFKSNEWFCADRVYLIRQAVPDFECFGSLCMNRVHGDKVNVYAAKSALQTTGNFCRCIWMPTQAATYPLSLTNSAEQGIPVLDRAGKVLPEVVQVMELCAESNIIFATGHSSVAESFALAAKAKEIGVQKFVVTHVNTTIWKMTADQIRKITDLNAYVEYCFLCCLWGPGTPFPTMERQSAEEFVQYAKIIPERSFISTDLGQAGMPHPVEGMRRCIDTLKQGGVGRNEMDLLFRSNPAKLMKN